VVRDGAIRCRMRGGFVHGPGPEGLVVVPSPEQRMFVSWWFADIVAVVVGSVAGRR
jgi:hypothetical protein